MKEIQIAVDNARKSDVAVVVLGGNNRTCGENKSRTSLELPGHQLRLLQEVVKSGKPVVLVLVNGRPLSVNWADKHVPAIVEAWYPGSQGGKALADILFGDYNPGGKLTVTFPRTVGQIPFNFPHKPSSQVDGGNKTGLTGNMSRVNGALYPFGYGLSYTTFKYSDLTFSSEKITPEQSLVVRCRVTNTGSKAGDEVVQLYIRDVQSSVTTYEKNLRGFERVHLKPGESKEISFMVTPADLELLNLKNDWVVESGEFKVMIGASSEDIRLEKPFMVLPYNELNIQKKIIPNEALLPILDSNMETYWTGKKGDYINIPMDSNAGPDRIGICWKTPAAGFEIQASSGGGQFLTVYKGIADRTGEVVYYPLDLKTVSDIRILVTEGEASVAEVKVKGIKQ